jgi:uncharacterized membrane protein YczE
VKISARLGGQSFAVVGVIERWAVALAGLLVGRVSRRALAVGTRAVLLLGGSLTIASAVAIMLWNQFGPGPLDVFIGAVRNATGMPLTFAVWATIGVLTLVAWALGRRPGPATLAMPLVIGPTMQVLLGELQRFDPPGWLAAKLAIQAGAVALAGVGAGAVIASRLGSGTGELLAAAASDRTGGSEPRLRVVLELSFLLFGVLLGGPIGLGTLVVALGIGPAVAGGQRMVESAVDASRRQVDLAHAAYACR